MMGLCTTTTFQPLPNLLPPKTHIRSLHVSHSLRLRSRSVSVRATSSSEESGVNGGEEQDRVVSTYQVPKPEDKKLYGQHAPEAEEEPVVNGSEGQSQITELLENYNLKLDTDDSYVFLLYGGGALVTLWLASAIIGAIDSIPLVPKLMELVGLGYTIWFSSRYLIFKKNREELVAKIQVLKQQVLGSNDDIN